MISPPPVDISAAIATGSCMRRSDSLSLIFASNVLMDLELKVTEEFTESVRMSRECDDDCFSREGDSSSVHANKCRRRNLALSMVDISGANVILFSCNGGILN